jgi:hypothetical protein
MKGDYLWDRSGRPDPEVAALERQLGPLRFGVRSCISASCIADPVAPHTQDAEMQDLTPGGGSRWAAVAVPLALAATIVLLVAGTWVARPDPGTLRTAAAPAGSWTFEPVSGSVSLASEPIESGVRVPTDRWLETGPDASARLSAGDVGTLRIGPLSRLRLVRDAPGAHRLALARGSLDAFIWASPRQFFIETPSAVAVDLGCAYRLEVDEDGTGRLRVTLGWVGFELDGRESLVPSGAVCLTRPGRGPGTPHFEDATPGFRTALEALDTGGARGNTTALEQVLREARPRDALSLWHLLSRLDRAGASRVYDRLASLAPPPPQVAKERILAGDRQALDAWWDSLGFAPVSRYREFMER